MLYRLVFLTTMLVCVLLSIAYANDPLFPDQYLWRYYDLPTPTGDPHILFVADINSQGTITAWSANDGSTFTVAADGTPTRLTCPGGTIATIASLNTRGEVVGTCFAQGHNQGARWRRQGERYEVAQTFVVPGSFHTEVHGVNDWQHVVGTYTDPQGGGPYSFFGANGQYMQIGSFAWVAQSITNWHGIVGYFSEIFPNTPSRRHGFFYYWGQTLQVDVPGGRETLLWDMNERGECVGFFDDANFIGRSFHLAGGVAREIVSPATDVLFVDVAAISNTGVLAGRVLMRDPDDPNNRFSRGFTATPIPTAFHTPAQAATVQVLRQALPPRRGIQVSLDTCDDTTPLKLRARLGCR